MAWKQIREAADEESTKAPRVWFFLSLAASMGANIATSGVVDLEHPPTWLRVLVAGWPVLAFFGGSLRVLCGRCVGHRTCGARTAAALAAARSVA